MNAKPERPNRKHLHSDALLTGLYQCFENIPDGRNQPTYPLVDVLMAALGIFLLKEPSLLAFERIRTDENLKAVLGIQAVPRDTQMRQTLDEVDYKLLYPAFDQLFRLVQRHKGLEDFVFFQDTYLLSLDGTQYFRSEKIHCDNCLKRNLKNGQVQYYHQFLGAVLLHPEHSEVIPLCPEPILQQDGSTKNDCEQNATLRWIERFRQTHPKLKVTVTADGLSSKGPQIRALRAHEMHFLLMAQDGDHESLRRQIEQACEAGTAKTHQVSEGKTTHRFVYLNDVPLNDSNPDLLVNYLEYWEDGPAGLKRFAWVTDHRLTSKTVMALMRGGRSRWKIENETFNTLKNQGYEFEHNYGHGDRNLSVVFALLMMLAFFIDQIQQRFSKTFILAYRKMGSKRALWERIRGLFHDYLVTSMEEVYAAIAFGIKRPRIEILDTS